MTDHLHPAIDIPGGLWRGAIVRVHSIEMTLTVVSMAGGPYIEGRRGPWDLADLSLDLHAPDGMGLGLAGLAARVAGRCGYEWSPADGIDDLAEMLADERWAPIPWRYWYEDGLSAQVIREAATLLARLDRLAAAVDPAYTVRSGVVPQWSRLEPVDGDPQYGWTLLVPLPNGDSVGKCFLPLDEPDPIEAAGAALEVRGG